MKLTVAGGCGEHGRNCFFAEGNDAAFLVDCGIMPGTEEPYPRLSDKNIQAAKWLFITHSHIDHTGALPWLIERGFSGCVAVAKETAGQLSFLPERVCFVDELTPALSPVILADELSVRWGKSGHCAGGVWYDIHLGGEKILFSGDYAEDTLAYACDPIRGVMAGWAVLDSAYGETKQTPADYRTALTDTAAELIRHRGKILFPVPKYGRGLELMLLLRERFPTVPIMADAHLQGELLRINDIATWLKPEAIVKLKGFQKSIGVIDSSKNGLMFISDPQLKSPEEQKLARGLIVGGGGIILTGNTDKGSFSEDLLLSGRAFFSRYAVHMSDSERTALEAVNHFENVVPYHR